MLNVICPSEFVCNIAQMCDFQNLKFYFEDSAPSNDITGDHPNKRSGKEMVKVIPNRDLTYKHVRVNSSIGLD
jgi:hypothetical protein